MIDPNVFHEICVMFMRRIDALKRELEQQNARHLDEVERMRSEIERALAASTA